MPYTGPGDDSLPENVKALPEDKRAQWVAVFNSAMDKCTKDGGSTGDCESSAFAQANGVVLKKDDQAGSGDAERQEEGDSPIKKFIAELTGLLKTIFGISLEPTEGDEGGGTSPPPEDGEVAASTEQRTTEQRAMNLEDVMMAAYDEIMLRDEQAFVNGFYSEDNQMFAVVSSGGKLFRVDVLIENDAVAVSPDWKQVKFSFPETGGGVPAETPAEDFDSEPGSVSVPVEMASIQGRSKFHIQRENTGRFRWFSVSASAVLNRVGEIDSTALMDSFVSHIEETGEYPYRDFFHLGEQFRTGKCDFVAREGYLLITSGLYDDSDLAAREVLARTESPEDWGDSIEYLPQGDPEQIEVIDGVKILVYKSGVLRSIATLPEKDAAALFTSGTIKERSMNEHQMEAWIRLFNGDEEAAKAWLMNNVDRTNEQVTGEGLLARSNKTATPQPPTEPADTIHEFELDDAAAEKIAGIILARIPMSDKEVKNLGEQLEAMRSEQGKQAKLLLEFREQLDAFQLRADAEQEELLADMPARSLVNVTYRPRIASTDTLPEDGDDVAKRTLSKIPAY